MRSSPGVGNELARVLADWAADPAFAELTLARMGEVATRFGRYVTNSGYDTFRDLDTEVCAAFIDAPTRTGANPTANTRHFRRTTIRTLTRTLRQLGVAAPDPTIDIILPARDGTVLRPLTDDENTLCRTTSFVVEARDTRRPAAWALAETTATTGEITMLTTRHLHDDGTTIEVELPGGRGAHARIVTATTWATLILRRRLDELEPGAPLVHRSIRPAGSGAAQAAVCNLISVVMRANDLQADPGVRPASVRLWRARHEFLATGSLEAAARLVGARSLDRLADQLDHQWQP
jgi:hypothetical protein